jgi:hypothetical protein
VKQKCVATLFLIGEIKNKKEKKENELGGFQFPEVQK